MKRCSTIVAIVIIYDGNDSARLVQNVIPGSVYFERVFITWKFGKLGNLLYPRQVLQHVDCMTKVVPYSSTRHAENCKRHYSALVQKLIL